ncbi:MAG: glycosyl hydrolase 53 family protein [Bacteroidota bacterium]
MLNSVQHTLLLFILSFSFQASLQAQNFFFGADLSYVNEMEDCGVSYREAGQDKDPYQIFTDRNFNLVRLRLWHTPSWYDDLNDGHRYSDLADVIRSIERAKAKGMQVLLDFHLSDLWADPSRQIVPAAWAAFVDDQEILGDSLYNYVYETLERLNELDLLPELVQMGNETNRGILLSEEDNNAGWTLDWDRNSYLFNRAISAVRDLEATFEVNIELGLHFAGPANAAYFVEEFIANGVTDFDWIGLSYYWAWHQPTTIAETGQLIADFKLNYPDKEVIVLETGYIWTLEFNDQAQNIISATHPDYTPPSPDAQYRWLVDLTREIMSAGGDGLVYWEPAWVSSPCFTLWGQGSHQEHATFFDFNNGLIEQGGIAWPQADYSTVSTQSYPALPDFSLTFTTYHESESNRLQLNFDAVIQSNSLSVELIHLDGARHGLTSLPGLQDSYRLDLPELASGLYFVLVQTSDGKFGKQPVVIK